MLSRRAVVLAPLAGLVAPTQAAALGEWDAFKARFLHPEGRIVDTGNGGVSHTEGQGWGLLFAAAFDDPTAFKAILQWTTRMLRRSRDALHSWRYVPGAANRVADTNNATDGDLFIAMALSRAARRWSRPDYAAAAATIVHDILRLLVRRAGPRTLLLPGVQGFETQQAFTLNLSYYAFPAMQELAACTRNPLWDDVRSDGLTLIRDGRFGQWMLPPDWLQISRTDGTLEPASRWPPRFSYDAIRVPLYLSWAGQTPADVGEAFRTYWGQQLPALPAWVDLATGAVAPYAAPPGMQAVGALSNAPPTSLELPVDFPSVAAAPDYYSAALTLLTRIAWQESRHPA
jgi:endoglucanase